MGNNTFYSWTSEKMRGNHYFNLRIFKNTIRQTPNHEGQFVDSELVAGSTASNRDGAKEHALSMIERLKGGVEILPTTTLF